MRYSQESAPIAADEPSPEQLSLLVSRLVVLAKQNQAYRRHPQAQNPRSHFVVPRSQIIVPSVWEAPFGFRYEHKLSARVSKNDFRSWSMRLHFGYDVTDMGSQRGCERHRYSFEWDDRLVRLARHAMWVAPSTEKDLGDYVDSFSVPDDMADEFGWRRELEQVTAGDVTLLTRDVNDFGRGIAGSNLATQALPAA